MARVIGLGLAVLSALAIATFDAVAGEWMAATMYYVLGVGLAHAWLQAIDAWQVDDDV